MIIQTKLAKIGIAIAAVILEIAYQILRRRLKEEKERKTEFEKLERRPDDDIH